MSKVPKIISLQYPKENVKNEVFFKLIVPVLVCVCGQSCPNYPKYQFLCNILRKKWAMKCIFLNANKHESFLQVDTMIFDGGGQAFPNSQNSKFAMSLQYRKKELRDENDFLHADKQS